MEFRDQNPLSANRHNVLLATRPMATRQHEQDGPEAVQWRPHVTGNLVYPRGDDEGRKSQDERGKYNQHKPRHDKLWNAYFRQNTSGQRKQRAFFGAGRIIFGVAPTRIDKRLHTASRTMANALPSARGRTRLTAAREPRQFERLARRQRHGLFQAKFHKRFRWNRNLPALTTGGNRGARAGACRHSDARSLSSAGDPANKRAKPRANSDPAGRLLAFSFAAHFVRTGNDGKRLAANDDVGEFQCQIGAARNATRGLRADQAAMDGSASGRHNLIAGLERRFKSSREALTRSLLVRIDELRRSHQNPAACWQREGFLCCHRRKHLPGTGGGRKEKGKSPHPSEETIRLHLTPSFPAFAQDPWFITGRWPSICRSIRESNWFSTWRNRAAVVAPSSFLTRS